MPGEDILHRQSKYIWIKQAFLSYQPSFYIPGLGREVRADLDQLPFICGKGQGVAFLLDLPQGLLGGSVQFELHDIDVAIGLQDEVDSSVRGVVFYLRVQADQLEDDEEDVPVMQFRIPLRVPANDRLVGGIGEEALEAAEEGVVIAMLHLFHKTADLERGLWRADTRIEWKQVFHETLLYLLIGESQFIDTETRIVILDG